MLSILFGDMSEIPGPGIGGAIIKAHLATHPVLALAALMFAAIGYVRHAIIALGAIVAMTWLNYMPSVVLHGLDFDGAAAVADAAADHRLSADGRLRHRLAARNQRLGLAAALVSIPTFCGVFGVIAFTIGVALHGFWQVQVDDHDDGRNDRASDRPHPAPDRAAPFNALAFLIGVTIYGF